MAKGRGYFAVYRPGEMNRCPSCGRANWYVGRSMAECGFCAMPLAICDDGMAKGRLASEVAA